MSLIELMIAGIYTFSITLISAFIGYLIGHKDFQRVVNERILKEKYTQEVRKPSGGAVKMITPQEIAIGNDEQAKRIKELLS